MKNKLGYLKTEKGMTYVEIMLAVAILAIIAAPLLSTVISTVRNNSTAKEKTEAIALAEMVMGNIKAQASITETTPPAIYLDVASDMVSSKPGTKLVPYFSAEKVKEGKISKSSDTTYTYDTGVAQKADFELAVDQSKLVSDGTVDIAVKVEDEDEEGKMVVVDKPFTGIDAASEKLDLKIEKSGADYSFSLDRKGSSSISGDFSPPVNRGEITVRVTYTGDATGTAKRLKIYTYDNSDKSDSLNIYMIDSSEENSGVKFIGTNKAFNLLYMDSDFFDYNSSINELYKITVVIKKGVDGDEIYSVSSYVKK
ncbi:hypothetical protein LY28_03328 [Ruminiclostridium sufflavum DSM 19573]|uniref:Prepilin-type N-terminal cleavage/methylation domain-containing protein n=1 Tax=Ruminiclostridium sufflavum DSM 19573 TaxID=1121337 RepID=A0A318XGI4_9FIRM|nr:hypothetical protein [Ruminiclostridium sufflavum]PYG85640.1 hypothetical protein LY28_03328 [Ruminiclostridium sufflavum DSM 19573]